MVMEVVVAFSSLARILGKCLTIPCLRFFFFFKVAVSSRRLIPFFMPGSVHSGSASWDDCGRMLPDKLRVSCFRIGSHTMPGLRHNQPSPAYAPATIRTLNLSITTSALLPTSYPGSTQYESLKESKTLLLLKVYSGWSVRFCRL